MPKDIQTDPRNKFVPLILPWLLGAMMLVVYWFTLNHWLTLLNLFAVSRVSGFVWQPELYGPLTHLATLPFHWLSPAKIPVALNFFSSLCAALTLVLLARCVAILPQDRTELQRQREKSDFGFLTGWQSYFPPLLAVLMLGLQLTFWEHATSFTGEMLDLLLFVFILWQLLEYRLDEKEWRLAVAVIAYGAGISETWMFIGFFPLFLTAIVWLRKLEFFNIRFLIRMILFLLAGMSFFFLLPLVAKFNPHFKLGIWAAMRPNIRLDWLTVKAIQEGDVRVLLAQASLATLLPLLVMSIRWTSGYGDNSRIGAVLANNMVHLVHAAVFTVCVWVMFDPPFAPAQLFAGCPYPPLGGSPCLTLDFLCALSIGYCTGYFLLIFGRKPRPSRRDSKPQPVFPPPLMWLCPLILTGIFACSLIVVGALIYKNKPVIKEVNSDLPLKFAQLTTENLPAGGAIVLCDSDRPGTDLPLRAMLIEAAIAREGRTKDFPVLDTQSLNWASYHQIIHERYPDKIPLIVKPSDRGMVNRLKLFAMISISATSNTVCYLHPSHGYYFEHFYEEPHGLAYPLKVLSNETILPPPLDQNLIAQNEMFWDRLVETLGPSIDKALVKPDPTTPKNGVEWLLMHLHPVLEANQNAIIVGMLCSRCLDDWGVQLQRAGELNKAAQRFQDAKRFDPANVVADVNLAFNQVLRTKGPIEIDPTLVNVDAFGQYRNWNEAVTAFGPYDEISYCFFGGSACMENGFSRQAAKEYTRVRELAPDDLTTRFQLAHIYLINQLPDRALEALHDPRTQPSKFGLNENNSTDVNLLAAAAYYQKNQAGAANRLMDAEIDRHPNDNTLLIGVTKTYMTHGLYTNALRIINGQLERTPDDLTWLFGKGYASLQSGAYEDSIKAMTRVLDIDTNNSSARFNRALASFQSGQIDAARADYDALQTTYTNSFRVAYGLGEIAWRKKDNAEALRNYQIFLANAPTNAPEFNTIQERVTQLGGK